MLKFNFEIPIVQIPSIYHTFPLFFDFVIVIFKDEVFDEVCEKNNACDDKNRMLKYS